MKMRTPQTNRWRTGERRVPLCEERRGHEWHRRQSRGWHRRMRRGRDRTEVLVRLLRLRRLVLLQKLLKLRHLQLLKLSHPLLHLLLLQRRTARLRQLFQQGLQCAKSTPSFPRQIRTASPSLLPASIEVSELVGSSAHKGSRSMERARTGPPRLLSGVAAHGQSERPLSGGALEPAARQVTARLKTTHSTRLAGTSKPLMPTTSSPTSTPESCACDCAETSTTLQEEHSRMSRKPSGAFVPMHTTYWNGADAAGACEDGSRRGAEPHAPATPCPRT